MKIKSIKIENMHKVKDATYELDDIDYIVGDNGAGKTTILEAIQLAILGYIPGFGKRNTDIMKHSSSKHMSVCVTFDTGDYISRDYHKSGSSASCEIDHSFGTDDEGKLIDTKFIVGNTELPVFNFSSFLSMSANEQKKWFLDFLPKAETNINWAKEFNEATKNIIEYNKEVVDRFANDVEMRHIETVKDVHEYIKSCISFTKGQISSKQSTLSDLVYYEDVKDMDSDYVSKNLEDLNNRLLFCNNKLSSLSYVDKLQQDKYNFEKTLPDSIENIEKKINSLNEELVNLKDIELTDLQTKLKEAKTDVDESYANYLKVSDKFRTSINPSTIENCCPYTNEECNTLVKYKEELEAKYEEVEGEYKSAYEDYQKNDTRYKDLGKRLSSVNSETMIKQHEIDYNQSIIHKYEYINKSYTDYMKSVNLDSDDSIETVKDEIDFINSEIERYNEIKDKLSANAVYETLTDKVRKELVNYEIEMIHLNTLKTYTGPNELQAKLAEKPFEDLKANMTNYLKLMFNEDVECMFTLSSKSNSFEFGILRNGVYVPFTTLSSGEKCIYMIALQSCIVSKSENTLHTILVDDLFDHLDKSNSASLINSVKKTDCQYIIAGVNEIEDSEITIMRL